MRNEFVLGVILILQFKVNRGDFGFGESSRITYVKTAQPGFFPYHVSLTVIKPDDSLHHFCSGTIVHRYHVLSTAACARMYDTRMMVIVAGNVDMHQLHFKGRQERRIDRVYEYLRFNNRTLYGDLTILITTEGFQFNNFVRPLRIFESYMKFHTKTEYHCTVSGWGMILSTVNGSLTATHETSNHLLYVTAKLHFEHESCQPNSSSIVHVTPRSFLCASVRCMFDRGGPLMCDERLAGMASWQPDKPCGDPKTLEVFTEVPQFTDFLCAVVPDICIIARSGASAPPVLLLSNYLLMFYTVCCIMYVKIIQCF